MNKYIHNLGKITIRELALSDVPIAVKVYMEAFIGYFLTFLSKIFLKQLYKFYIQGDTEIALTINYNNRPIAVLLGTLKPQNFIDVVLVYKHFFYFLGQVHYNKR